ncbi:protection of telomeres protein 1b [Mercurialis annua]|uniref:protection of telomeres protein 1b n=1 Tax=Mercurialis annua TaxID=3986 RepID=UPI00216092EA|nr:protection of telomeres protein 1b [Mercurialis annua]
MEGEDYKYHRIQDALTSINQKVSLFGSVIEIGLPRKTRGTDWVCTLKIIDDSFCKNGLTVNMFSSTVEMLPRILSLGDIIQLSRVLIKSHHGEANAVFNKSYSWFALYEAKIDGDFLPYQCSPKYNPRDDNFNYVSALRKWLADFRLDDGSDSFIFLREMKEREQATLACKVLHICKVSEKQWMVLLWDGTDSPPNKIDSKLENKWEKPFPLQVEPLPLARDISCTFPAVGTILRVMIDQENEKHVLHLLNIGKWVKFLSILCEVHVGLWRGVLTPFTKLRYISNESPIALACQKSSDARLSSRSRRIPYWCFAWHSSVTEIDYDGTTFVTLMDVLTHSQVTAKFKCIVRAVAAFPWEVEDYCNSDGTYGIRLTIEDPTARIHAYIYAEDGEEFFGGHPSIDVLRNKRNTLLGVAVNDEGKEVTGAPRNPPWIECCIKSYYIDINNKWGSRHFRIFATKHVA